VLLPLEAAKTYDKMDKAMQSVDWEIFIGDIEVGESMETGNAVEQALPFLNGGSRATQTHTGIAIF